MSLLFKMPTLDISAILADVLAVKAKTDLLPPDPASESLLEAAIASRASQATANAIKAQTDLLPPDPASETGNILAVKAQTDALPSDPADESNLEDILGRKCPFIDFWSVPMDMTQLQGAALDRDFPGVIVAGLPSGITMVRVVAILTIRAIKDTSGSDNYIDEANKTIRVKKTGGAWGVDDVIAITFDLNSLYCIASNKEAGPVIVGSHDIRSKVDGDDIYNFQTNQTDRGDAISAKANFLELYDIQMGIRIFYK